MHALHFLLNVIISLYDKLFKKIKYYHIIFFLTSKYFNLSINEGTLKI